MFVADMAGFGLRRVRVDIAAFENRRSFFLHLSPDGDLPVLDDDGFVLWGGNAICAYLADVSHGRGVLPWPEDAQRRADAQRWLDWEAGKLRPGLEQWRSRSANRSPPDGFGEGAVLHSCLDQLNRHLRERYWLCDQRISVADAVVAAVLLHASIPHFPIRHYLNLEEWLMRVVDLHQMQVRSNESSRAAEESRSNRSMQRISPSPV